MTLQGRTVGFSFDDALQGLFGTASVSGDTLFFTPVAWSAASLNGTGFDLTHATLHVRVSANPGYAFDALALLARGDYLLEGAGSRVGIGGQMRAFDAEMPQTDLAVAIDADGDLSLRGLPTRDWSAHATLDVPAYGSSGLVLTLAPLLLASSGVPNTLAFVEMKFVGLDVSTHAVPVPEADTWSMMLTGLGLVGFTVLRRSRR